jgi:hypothetical protein
MALTIPNIRPNVISNATKMELYDFLRFRHVFRNVYSFNLDQKKMEPLVANFENKLTTIKKELGQFIAWVNRLAQKIE